MSLGLSQNAGRQASRRLILLSDRVPVREQVTDPGDHSSKSGLDRGHFNLHGGDGLALLPDGLALLLGHSQRHLTSSAGVDDRSCLGVDWFLLLLSPIQDVRSETTTAFAGLFSNHWLWAAIGLAGVLQIAVVHLPLLQGAFGTAALSAGQWLACLALASSVLWFDELRKLVLRRRSAAGR